VLPVKTGDCDRTGDDDDGDDDDDSDDGDHSRWRRKARRLRAVFRTASA
jgi:hypothetical protein